MPRVRDFTPDDIDAVAELYRRVFHVPNSSVWSEDKRTAYFKEVFLKGPYPGTDIKSHVYELNDGRIVGFAGIVPVDLYFLDRPIRAARLTQFCVDPEHRGLAGLSLLKDFLAGPQDLSFTDDANANMVQLWEFCGGKRAQLYSINWVRALRPFRFATIVGARSGLASLATLMRPLADIFDWVMRKFPSGPFRQVKPETHGIQLDIASMPDALAGFVSGRAIRPRYAADPLAWHLDRAAGKVHHGEFRRVLVEDTSGQALGWYLYYQKSGNMGEVIQIAANHKTIGPVLDQLFFEAWQAGLVALKGRIDPLFMQALSDRYCLFYKSSAWAMAHSRDERLLQVFLEGKAFMSRLEGEWCLRFR